ncbi:hypothetical protein D3C72_1566420 [compost metagenome]
MVGSQLAVNAVIGITEFHRAVAAVVFRHFLLNDIGADSGGNVVGLAGEIGTGMIVHAIFVERRVAQIGPQHGDHTQLVSALEGAGNFFNLAA